MHCNGRDDVLLSVEDLDTHFFTYRGVVRATDGLTFPIYRGEITGLVGESGSGKSVTAFSILQLVRPPGRTIGGRVMFEGRDLLSASEKQMRSVRGREISMVFQEPRGALNPLMRVGRQITRVLRLREEGISERAANRRSVEVLRAVGIADPERCVRAYPHELSSGMCQRVMIAVALCGNPKLLIADEPTTGLDVTVAAKVLDLLRARVQSAQVSCLFITHNLGVVAELCDRLVVMYGGKLMERGQVEDVFESPAHPYTQGLIRSTLRVDVESSISTIPGDVPNAMAFPPGCRFHPRCPFAEPICQEAEPEVVPLGGGRHSRCHIASGAVDRELRDEEWELGLGQTEKGYGDLQ